MIDIRLSRRTLFAGAGAAGAAAVIGGGWALFSPPEKVVRDMVRRALPGVRFHEAELAQFSRDFVDIYFPYTRQKLKLRAIAMISGVIGYDWLSGRQLLPPNLGDMDRHAVTLLLSNSDFFQLDDPATETVSYWGIDETRACANPFARLDVAS